MYYCCTVGERLIRVREYNAVLNHYTFAVYFFHKFPGRIYIYSSSNSFICSDSSSTKAKYNVAHEQIFNLAGIQCRQHNRDEAVELLQRKRQAVYMYIKCTKSRRTRAAQNTRGRKRQSRPSGEAAEVEEKAFGCCLVIGR